MRLTSTSYNALRQHRPVRNVTQRLGRFATVALLASSALVSSHDAAAAGFVVTNTNDSGAGSLRDAVAQANAAAGPDIITFSSGLAGTITLTNGELIILDDVVIDGSAAGQLIVSAGGSDRVIGSYGGDVDLIQMDIRHGNSIFPGGAVFVNADLRLISSVIRDSSTTDEGGGAYVTGNALIRNSLVRQNSAEEGGGLRVEGETTVDTSNLLDNTAENNGGGISANDGLVHVIDSTITANDGCTLGGDGGGISALGAVTISNSTVNLNTCAEGDGGGVFVESNELLPRIVTIDQSSVITGNSARDGGGLEVRGVTVNIDDSTLTGNEASDDGGAIVADEAELTIGNSTLTGNDATSLGGAIFAAQTLLTVNDSTLSSNTAGSLAGAIFLQGSLHLSQSDLLGNTAGSGGGAITADLADDGTASFVGGSISGNTASDGLGGGAYIEGRQTAPLTIDGTLFENNDAMDGLGGGLAVFESNVSLDGARFTGNAASDEGGGAFFVGAASIEMSDSSFANNTSGETGGGAYLAGVDDVGVNNSTFTDNTAAESGGGLSSEFADTVSVVDSSFEGNSSTGLPDDDFGGGGLDIDGSLMATVTRSTFHDNTAANGGGLRVAGGDTVTVTDSNFTENTADELGGALLVSGADHVDISGGTVSANAAEFAAGAAVVLADSASIADVTVEQNIASGNVGGLGLIGVESVATAGLHVRANEAPFGAGLTMQGATEATISDSTIAANISSAGPFDFGIGGGVYAIDSNLVVEASTIAENIAESGGGIKMFGGSLELTTGTIVERNTADFGGGIQANDATLTTSGGVRISGNTATGSQGGGVSVSGESATFVDTTITDNIAAGDGGGVWSNGFVRFTTSSLNGNEAGGHGGGASVDRSVAFRSLFTDNHAGLDETLAELGNGGAIQARASLSATSSTFHANSATGTGGAIDVDNDSEEGRSSFSFLTVTENSAGVAGGGIAVAEGGANQPQGLIATSNRAPIDPDLSLPVAPEYSLVDDLGTTPPLDLDGRPAIGLEVGTDPLLGPLTDNGGPTHTRMLMPRSPAIGAGGTITDDFTGQRGVFVDEGETLDAGATQYDGALPVWIPVTPARLVDTRSSGETVDGRFRGAGTLDAGDTLRVDIAGRGGIPVSAAGAIINVTAVNPESVGFITVYPCTDTLPNASSLNYTTGVNLPNEVVAGLDSEGVVCIFTSSRTQLTLDVVGYLAESSPFEAVEPARLLDTRQTGVTIDGESRAAGRSTAGSEVTVRVAGRAGIPDDAVAAVVNVVAISPSGTGFVTVHACLDDRPLTSSLNYIAGGNRGNEILAGLDDDGQICVYTSRDSHLVVDVVGHLAADLDVTAVAPARVFETRANTPTVDGEFEGVGRLDAGTVTRVQLAGRADVATDATTVNINLTAINAARNGFITVFPCGEQPLAASLNFVPGVNGGNDLISGLDADGGLCVFTSSTTDLTIDIAGYTTL